RRSSDLWFLRNSLTSGVADVPVFPFGAGTWNFVSGDWNFPLSLLAAGGPVPSGPSAPALNDGQLQGAVQAALSRLAGAGVAPAVLQGLAAAQYAVAPLPGATLGLADVNQHRVLISADAAGYGWFVDGTPLQDEEF